MIEVKRQEIETAMQFHPKNSTFVPIEPFIETAAPPEPSPIPDYRKRAESLLSKLI